MPRPTPAPRDWTDPSLPQAFGAVDKSLSAVEKTLKLQSAGPIFNAGGDIAKSGSNLKNAQTRQQISRLLLGSDTPTFTRRGRQSLQQLTAGLGRVGSTLEKCGKKGDGLDKLGNLSEGLGSLYEKDWVGVAQSGANTGLSNASSWAGAAAGAWAGSKAGAAAGGALGLSGAGVGAVPGAVIGGVIGGVSGAIAASYTYDALVKPELDDAMNKVSVAMQNRQARVDSIYRRIEADRTLLEQSHRPPSETLSGVEVAFVPQRDAELMHQRAEQIRAQQMDARVQQTPLDGIDDRIKALQKLERKTNDPEGRARLAREIELLDQRQRQAQDKQTAVARQQAQDLARQKLAQDALNKKLAEEARLKAQEEARQRTLDETKRNDEERARRKAVEDQRSKAAEEDRKKAEEKTMREAQEQARQDAARRKAEEAARLCGPNGRPDSAGGCFCDPGFESVGGRCVKTAPTCATHSECPAGFLCNASGVCVADARSSGQEAVRMRAELEQRRLAGGTASVLGSTSTTTTTTTALGSRFGLGQMPGGSAQTTSSHPGAPSPTTPQRPTTTGVSPTPSPTPVPTQQSGWYLFEAVLIYTDEQLKKRCTSTNRWAVQFATLAQAQAFPKTMGDNIITTVRDTHPEATLVSSRLVSGPTLTMPDLTGGQGGVLSVRCQ